MKQLCSKAKQMATPLNIKQKEDWAKLLFVQDDMNQKEIAVKVGVSEKTLSKWANDPEKNWNSYKLSLTTTRITELKNFYRILKNLNEQTIKDIEAGNRINPKDADAAIKYSAAIKNLETETSVAQIIEVARMFINDMQTKDAAFALRVANEFDGFIKDRLKRF